MSPVSALLLLVLIAVVAMAPRRWALLGMLLGVFFQTQASSIDVLGLNLYPLRFLEAVAFVRVLARGELRLSRLNRIDGVLLAFYVYTAVVWTLQSPKFSAQQVAFAVDASFCYLALRAMVRDLGDLRWLLSALVVVLIPYTALVLRERLTGSTSFGFLGAHWTLYVREGVPRCQGSFRHPILLGSVAASFLALYLGQWFADRKDKWAGSGIVLCVALVLLSHSGGPATTAGAVIFAWLLWRLRERMRLVRWTAAAALVALILFMKAPIWYLPFKVSSIVGGGGYHRSVLMERAWQHLGEWWLVGMDIADTRSWLPYDHDLVGGADITNQFVAFGIKAGLPSVLMSIGVLGLVFAAVGRALLASRRVSGQETTEDQLLLWGLGVAVFSHAVSWIGVAYFDQSWAVWLLHVAAVSSAAQSVTAAGAPALARDRSRAVLPDHVWAASRRRETRTAAHPWRSS